MTLKGHSLVFKPNIIAIVYTMLVLLYAQIESPCMAGLHILSKFIAKLFKLVD